MMRTVLGFLAAPIVPAMLVAMTGNWPVGIFVAIFGYPAVLLLGIPTHIILQKVGLSWWPAYVTTGFLAGGLSELLYSFILVATDNRPPNTSAFSRGFSAVIGSLDEVWPLFFVGCMGAIGALTFWLIARPDARHPGAQ
jgi:hypothetical protein